MNTTNCNNYNNYKKSPEDEYLQELLSHDSIKIVKQIIKHEVEIIVKNVIKKEKSLYILHKKPYSRSL
jgi:hypothetical protein